MYIEINGFEIEYNCLNTILGYDKYSVFSFYYYENELKDFLINEKIIVKEYNASTDGEIFYLFKNYEKLKQLDNKLKEIIEENLLSLKRDFNINKIIINEI